MKRIEAILKKADFKKVGTATWDNRWCCVNLNYDRTGQIVINNQEGEVIGNLPINQYALIGWLLTHRQASLNILDF